MALKVALIELGGSHEECMLTQMIALKSIGSSITLICTPEIRERNPHFEAYIDAVLVVDFTQKNWEDFKFILGINRFLRENQFQKAIINTAQGAHIRNLCLTAPKEVEFIGIIHTIRKFQGSFTQKLIHRKIKKYLVLSDFLLQKITIPRKLKIESFYPVSFPKNAFPLDKEVGETWITIVGGVENRRKDLNGFLQMIEQLPTTNYKFIFLGKSNPENEEVIAFKNQIEAANRKHQFLFFEKFIAPHLFDVYIQNSDFLCPIIHPNTPSAEQYISNQISGMFNLAYSYQIPLLIHAAYNSIEDLQKSAFFYELSTFGVTMENALLYRAEKVSEIDQVLKWKEYYQEEKFLKFFNA